MSAPPARKAFATAGLAQATFVTHATLAPEAWIRSTITLAFSSIFLVNISSLGV
jgi:hypothetical protein